MGKNTIILLFSGFLLLYGCSAPLLDNHQEFRRQDIWRWGGGPLRRGWTEGELRPPLALKWTYKANSALGKAMIAADGRLIFGEKGGTVSIIDINTGKKQTQIKLEKRREVTCELGPDQLICAQRSGKEPLRAYDLKTGKLLWKSDAGPVWGEPLIVEKTLLIGNEWGTLFRVDPGDGEVLWQRDFGNTISGIAADELLGILTTDSGTVAAFDTEKGGVLWEVRLDGSIAAPPVISGGRIFAGVIEGQFVCLSLQEGQIRWKHEPVGAVYEMAGANNGLVVYGDTQGLLYCLDIDDGTEIWRLDTESVIGTSPLISGEHIYFGTLNKRLYCVNRRSGTIEWEFETRGRVRTTPVIWNEMLIAASENWFVYGFEKANR